MFSARSSLRTVSNMAQQNYVFRVRCEVETGEVLAVTGSTQDLGAWRKASVLPMVQDEQDR